MHTYTLFSFYKPYFGLFIADLLCAFGCAATGLLLPLGARRITNEILVHPGPDALNQILLTGLFMLVIIIIQTGCSYFKDYKGHYMGAMMERDIRNDLFHHCEKLSFSYYDNHTVGDLMSRITNDSLALAEFFHHVPEDLLTNAVKLLGAAIILFFIHWQTALVLLCFLPFMTAYTLYFNKKMAAALQMSREQMGGINAQSEDSLSGIRTVQSFTAEDSERKKFIQWNEKFLKSRGDGYKSEAVCWCGMETFAVFLTTIAVVYGGVMILKGSLTLGDLLVILLYLSYFTEPVKSIVNTLRLLQEGQTGFRRFLEIMETQPEIQDLPDAKEVEHVDGKIEFRHVDFCYGEKEEVFRDLNLTIPDGEYVALVGASGVGKTTLCSLIPRFYEPQRGEVLLDGIPVQQLTLKSLRQKIGIVQQDVYLFSGTVAENISYGNPLASRHEIQEAAKKAGADEFIQKLPNGYDTDIGPHGVKLSGGQQQRLSVARAFLKNPPILILDEATSSLDNRSEKVVQQSLAMLKKHRTTLVIAHRLSTVRDAERILVLDENGICEQGTHQELMAKQGVYAELYRASADV
ncbi:MAG: ABC transporter ATP-binding protein [Clostridiales bacterium]|nr:ABC transporter ATP-binding protein [Clostridiales bacterium]